MKISMRHLPIILLMATGFSCLAGCATFPPPKEAIPSTRIYGQSSNEVWDAVLASLAERDIRVTSMDKDSGRIVAEDGTIDLRQYELGRYDSKYCFCGSPGQYHVFKGLAGEYTISVTRVNENRTSVNIDASYRASQYADDRLAGWLPCFSKGVFEPLFLDEVESRLTVEKAPSLNFEWWKPSRGY
jgi:hypothetical protein